MISFFAVERGAGRGRVELSVICFTSVGSGGGQRKRGVLEYGGKCLFMTMLNIHFLLTLGNVPLKYV